MLKSLVCDSSNRFHVVDQPDAISEILGLHDHLLWLDLEAPTTDEFKLIQEEFGLHPLSIEDAMARHQRPKVEQYDTYYLVVFYAIALRDENEGVSVEGVRAPHSLRPGRDGHMEFSGTQPISAGKVEGPPESGAGTSLPKQAKTSPPAETGFILLRELAMFMGENYLITVHEHPIAEIDEAAHRWRSNAEILGGSPGAATPHLPGLRPLAPLEKHATAAHDGSQPAAGSPNGQVPEAKIPDAASTQEANRIGILLYSLLDTITDSYFPVVDNIVERIEGLEEQIFERFDQGAIASVFALKKDMLALRKVLAPERDVLNILTRRDIPIFDSRTVVYFQDIYDHVTRITDSIDTYRDLLSSALDSYLSMQSNRLNITVQTLTSVSIMLMSIATITGWYGMNFQNMPELASRFGYPGVMALALLVTAVEFAYFRRKGWL